MYSLQATYQTNHIIILYRVHGRKARDWCALFYHRQKKEKKKVLRIYY